MVRRTQLQTVERKAFGGSYFDSYSHAEMFRKYKPFNFGVRNAQLFSSELGSQLVNKKFTYYTVAKGNVYLLPPGTDDYEWSLIADADVDFRSTSNPFAATAQVGKAGVPFQFNLDRDWLHTPAVIKCEHPDLPPILIRSESPQQVDVNSWSYEGILLTSDKNAWIPAEYFNAGKRFIDITTAVSDELNKKYAGDQYGEMFKLQSWVGNYARKAEFTDKFIRTEMACRKEGRAMPKTMGYSVGKQSYYDGAIGVGYVYQQPMNVTNGGKPEVIEAGVFVSKIEARLEERILMDREMNMEFGHLYKGEDPDSSRVIKRAPGWRQIVKDGHYKEHNGSLTLTELYEYIAEIFLTRRTFSDRKIMLATGEGGIEFMHRLIAQEASQFSYIDTTFLRKRPDPQGYHDNELEFGAQFTKLMLPMGYVLEMVYDPIKDDRKLFPQKAPGTNRTAESYAMDIFDWGSTDQKAIGASRNENITMVMQDGVESYFTVCNVYDFETGAEKTGSNVYSNNKECGIYRETSGDLCVWDVTRVGRIQPNFTTSF